MSAYTCLFPPELSTDLMKLLTPNLLFENFEFISSGLTLLNSLYCLDDFEVWFIY
jgi:hypothetical protein